MIGLKSKTYKIAFKTEDRLMRLFDSAPSVSCRSALFAITAGLLALGCGDAAKIQAPDGPDNAAALTSSCPGLPSPWNGWRVSPPSEPGPQYSTNAYRWNCSNARVDASGRLHLLLTRSSATAQWQGAQVVRTTTYGPGRSFTANVASRLSDVTTIAPSSVFAFFLYKGPDGANEIDIEVSNWGGKYSAPLLYSVYPVSPTWGPPHQKHTGSNSSLAAPTTHKIQWNSSSVSFTSTAQGVSIPIGQWSYTPCLLCSTPYVPQVSMPLILNFWVDSGKKMGSALKYEVVISSVIVK